MSICSSALFGFRLRSFEAHARRAFDLTKLDQLSGGASRQRRAENVTAKLGEALAFCAGALNLISEGLKGNPRQVKRFLNAYFLRRKLATVAKMETIRDDVFPVALGCHVRG
jgi:hypothetical protein